MDKKLYRDEYHKMIGGVCSGLAEYFEVDVSIIRILFVITFFVSVGFITYVVLWIVIPRKGYINNNFNNPTVDYRVPPQQPGDPSGVPPPQPGNPFGNNAFENRPFENRPFENNPIQNMPPRQKSHAGIIVGVVLIILGGIILIDNYDLIPDFDFERLWPVVLVVVGGALIVSGQTKQAWQKQDWQNADKKDNSINDVPPAADNTSAETDNLQA
jgi:phage shock protein C